ncbi:MAG: hypothetical protein OXF44_14670 [Anaerolineaceae bacterium]|nr:hypothetical protein [Anaerolineaceae bacterium]
MEAFTTRGHWWLPGDDPENAIAGILTFDPRGEPKLELFGTFDGELMWGQAEKREQIILGVGDKGQAITLIDCLHLGSGLTASNFTWRSSSYIPHFAIQGHLFEHEQDIIFERLWLKFYGLEEWASTGKRWEPVDMDNPKIDRPTEDDVPVSLEGSELTIIRGHSWSGDQRRHLTVGRDATIEISPESHWNLEETISWIVDFQVFLSLAMGTSTWPTSIKAPNPDRENRQISIHFRPLTDFIEKGNLSEFLMVFTLEDLNSKLEMCLRNWFCRSKDLDQIFLHYNLIVSKRMTLVDTFLILAKAVEAYHRQRFKETIVDEAIFAKTYEVMKAAIPEEADERVKQKLVNSLKWANQPSLRNRLNGIRDAHKGLEIQLFDEYKTFVQRVVSHRNYLTHLDDDGKPDTKLEDVMVPICERLKYILEICLLSELGLDDEEMQQLVKNMSRINPMSPFLRPSQSES